MIRSSLRIVIPGSPPPDPCDGRLSRTRLAYKEMSHTFRIDDSTGMDLSTSSSSQQIDEQDFIQGIADGQQSGVAEKKAGVDIRFLLKSPHETKPVYKGQI